MSVSRKNNITLVQSSSHVQSMTHTQPFFLKWLTSIVSVCYYWILMEAICCFCIFSENLLHLCILVCLSVCRHFLYLSHHSHMTPLPPPCFAFSLDGLAAWMCGTIPTDVALLSPFSEHILTLQRSLRVLDATSEALQNDAVHDQPGNQRSEWVSSNSGNVWGVVMKTWPCHWDAVAHMPESWSWFFVQPSGHLSSKQANTSFQAWFWSKYQKTKILFFFFF